MIDLDAITPDTPVVICGKVEAIQPALAAGAFALIHADPPYHKVLDRSVAEWDHEHATPDAFLAWLGGIADEWRRLLAGNGSLYVWSSPDMAARVEVEAIRPRFAVINSITWAKPEGTAALRYGPENFRGYVEMSERLIFAEHKGADLTALGASGYDAACAELRGFVFEPLRAYLDAERQAARISAREVNDALGNQMAGHYFGRSQWALPTEGNYRKLRALFNRDGAGHLRREYEDLRREYEDLRREYEDLRRPFNVSADVPHTDVWTHPTVDPGRGRHPAEKPLDMMRDIVRASSRPGDLCLDVCAGSGSFSAACVDLGRRVVAIEQDERLVGEISARTDRHLAARTGELHRVEMAPIRGPLFEV